MKKQEKPRDAVSIIVFKDNLASRSFSVPTQWVTKLGIFLGCAAAITLIASLVAGKFYLSSYSASPAKLTELEQEIDLLKNTNHSLVAKLASPSSANTQSNTMSESSPVSTADMSSLPFRIDQQSVKWKGNILEVHFAIQYTAGDGGNQQGRILILAKGPETILGYPDGIFNSPDANPLFDQSKGEYFSVSRFREVNAEFGPLPKKAQITEVESLIFDQTGKILFKEKIPVNTSTNIQPKPPEKTDEPNT